MRLLAGGPSLCARGILCGGGVFDFEMKYDGKKARAETDSIRAIASFIEE